MIIGREILETAFWHSGFMSFEKNISDKYYRLENKIDELYNASAFCRIMRRSYAILKEAGEYSFSKKIAGKIRIEPLSINNSWIACWLALSFKSKMKDLGIYYKESAIGASIYRTENDFHEDALRTICIIGVSMFITNAAISAVLEIKIDLFGWIMRIAFILAGMSVIFSDIRWEEIKKESVFIRLLTTKKCDR